MQRGEAQRDREQLLERAIQEVDGLHRAVCDTAPDGKRRGERMDPVWLLHACGELAAMAREVAPAGSPSVVIAEAPTCFMRDTETEVEASFELPGVPRSSLRVHFAAGTLVVEGNRPERFRDGRPVFATRFHSGPFRQTISVPVPIDATGASALYREGCLTIRLPKRGSQSAGREKS